MKQVIIKVLKESMNDDSKQPMDSPRFKRYAQQLYDKTGAIVDAAHDLVRTKYKPSVLNPGNSALNRVFAQKWGVIHTYDQAKAFSGDTGIPSHLGQLDHSALAGHMISHLGRIFNAPDLEQHGTAILALHKHLNFDDDVDSDYFNHMQGGSLATLHDDLKLSKFMSDEDRAKIANWRSSL